MAKQYYNSLEFNRFKSIKNVNPLLAKLIIEEYIKKYPKDYEAWTHYVDLLVSIGEIEKAEEEIKTIEELSKNDEHFNSNDNRVKRFKKHLIFSKIKLLLYQEKYEELYSIYIVNNQLIEDIDFNHFIYYSQKKLGLSPDNQREPKSYLYRQIYEYREEKFLEHVKTHSADYNRDIEEQKQGIFVPDFPFEEVIKEIKKYIPSEKKLFFGLIEDTYIFKYDGCGRDKNKLQDYFKVICFHNTNNIITMYPAENLEYLPSIDLNYLIKEEPKLIRKRTQIEKFNMKYGNK